MDEYDDLNEQTEQTYDLQGATDAINRLAYAVECQWAQLGRIEALIRAQCPGVEVQLIDPFREDIDIAIGNLIQSPKHE